MDTSAVATLEGGKSLSFKLQVTELNVDTSFIHPTWMLNMTSEIMKADHSCSQIEGEQLLPGLRLRCYSLQFYDWLLKAGDIRVINSCNRCSYLDALTHK